MQKPQRPPGALLFGEPERPANVHVANVDGASRGNPGPASYGLIFRAPDGTTEFEIGKYLGRVTNNVAEYYALIAALDYASTHGIDRLLIRSDSELLVRQMQGRYKVKSPDLRPLHERAQILSRGLVSFAIEHVPRERNREADELANIALDRTSSHGAGDAAPETQPAPQLTPTSQAPKTPPSSMRRSENRDGRPIRARYSAGALHPLEALDLAEGDIVEFVIHPLKRSPPQDS